MSFRFVQSRLSATSLLKININFCNCLLITFCQQNDSSSLLNVVGWGTWELRLQSIPSTFMSLILICTMLLYGTLLDHWCFMNLVLRAICLFGNLEIGMHFGNSFFFFGNLGQELWHSELELRRRWAPSRGSKHWWVRAQPAYLTNWPLVSYPGNNILVHRKSILI